MAETPGIYGGDDRSGLPVGEALGTAGAPSIFNDVLGPVMVGPSSSHTAASVRIGNWARELAGGDLKRVDVCFDPEGSLAATYVGQGADIGLMAGFLGMDTDDLRIRDAKALLSDKNITAAFCIEPFAAEHPNHYKLNVLRGDGSAFTMDALSVGGGMARLITYDGARFNIDGGAFETLAAFDKKSQDAVSCKRAVGAVLSANERLTVCSGETRLIADITSLNPLGGEIINKINGITGFIEICALTPRLPVLSGGNAPFITACQIMEIAADRHLPLWEMAVSYECARGRIPRERVMEMAAGIVSAMRKSIQTGSAAEYGNRLLKRQSHLIGEGVKRGKLIPSDLLNDAVMYITAVMECKSSMNAFVAAPTAGSCGVLPGVLVSAAERMGLRDECLVQGLLAAGLIGALIAMNATFAAETAGCQAECGAASCMAAAGLTQIMGGTAGQCLAAASMALQNMLGLICDPVAGGAEFPCLGKNILAGMNAYSCCNMALSGYDEVVPLDETIKAMYAVGKMMPRELRCTGLGGLAQTPTGTKLAAEKNVI